MSELLPSDRSRFGSKSVNLAILARAGYCVPDGFCISTDAFKDHILKDSGDFRNISSSPTIIQQYRDIILEKPFRPKFEKELHEALQFIGGSTSDFLAVRSSAVEEDLSSGSFAGVYSTILDVNGKKEILDAIRSCWISYFSESALHYRIRKAVEDLNGMSIFIQRMIQPRVSGVLFTCWRQNNRLDHSRIDLVFGQARNLVDGRVAGKSILVNRKNLSVCSDNQRVQLGDRRLAKKMVSLGIEIELLMGSPQDIEWCLDHNGKLWILQTRPITEFLNKIKITDERNNNGWERANHEPFSTLGCQLAAKRYLNWVRATNHFYILNFKPRVKVKNNFVFHTVPWKNKTSVIGAWMLTLDLYRWFSRRHILKRYRCSILPRYDEQLSDIRSRDISSITNSDLLSCFSQTISIYLDSQYTSFPIARVASLSAHMLEFFLRLVIPEDEKSINAHNFLTGLDNIAIKRDMLLEEIAEDIVNELGDDKGKIQSFEQLMIILPQTENGKILSARLENFQERFGYIWADRYPRDPGWELSKEKLVLSLEEFDNLEKRETLQKRTEELRSRRSKAVIEFEEQLCRGMLSGIKRRIWRRLLKDVETFFPYKEQRNDHLYSVIMAVRSLGREISKRSIAEEIIERPSDIFFLTTEEIIGKGNVDNSPYWWKHLIESRKARYAQSLKFFQFGKSVVDRDFSNSLNQGEKELFGDGCSPGFETGTARVIKGMAELDRIRDGEILLCTSFRPAMSPILSRIGGLIVERGSIISHGAILSREYGVPAVFNIKNLTKLVADGDEVSVDGNTGIIKINSYETLDDPS